MDHATEKETKKDKRKKEASTEKNLDYRHAGHAKTKQTHNTQPMQSITAPWMKAIEHMDQTCIPLAEHSFIGLCVPSACSPPGTPPGTQQAQKHHKKHKDRCTDNTKPSHSINTNGIQREKMQHPHWYDSLARSEVRKKSKNQTCHLQVGKLVVAEKQNKYRTQYPVNTAENQKEKKQQRC